MTEEAANPSEKLERDIQSTRIQSYGYFFAQAVVAVWFFYEVIRGAYRWLRYGRDVTVRLSTYSAVPHSNWIGVNRILSFVWNLPIGLPLFTALLIFGFCGEAKRQELRELQGKRANLRIHEANG